MRRSIHRENVRHLEGLLKQIDDAPRRERLLQLLLEETAKLLEAERKDRTDKAAQSN